VLWDYDAFSPRLGICGAALKATPGRVGLLKLSQNAAG
jgi:hypothetical protein